MKIFLKQLSILLVCFYLSACGGSSDDSTIVDPIVTDPVVTDPVVTDPVDPEPPVEPEPPVDPEDPVDPIADITIHMIGDSTMTEYDQSRKPQAGWGEQVPMFVSDKATVRNWARGGRSSRSFYYEDGLWNLVKETIKTGDYLIIQFGHNDQKLGDAYEEFGTYAYCSNGSSNGEDCLDTEHSYYQFLKKYIKEARDLGAVPILMSPIVRKYFSGESIRNSGLHNLETVNTGELFARGNYPAAMKEVAVLLDVPMVDLTGQTKEIVEKYGEQAATESLYISADSTHPQVLFATLIAKEAMKSLQQQEVLADYIIEATSFISSPETLQWNDRYIGVANVKTLTLSAFDLSPNTGNLVATAPDGFLLSDAPDSTNWTTILTVPYENGAFTEKMYVQFTPYSEKSFNDSISFFAGGIDLGTVNVSGNGVDVGNGLPTYSRWFTEGGALAAITDGPITAQDASVVNLDTGSVKTFAVNEQDTGVARFRVYGPDLVSKNAGKYLEFSLTAATQTFSIDTISAWMTTSGGSTVQADIQYSFNSDFSNPVSLNEDPIMFSKDTMLLTEYNVTIQILAENKLYIRIYPYNAAGADTTGKYLAVYDVKVSGLSGD
ncbi:rhamnogalacturonan acetylesterase [Pseudoalteromonas sp. SG41-1]|nr:rhamnogalacturonan acetylesterase [Pseudoalteromonas sp. SG41-1]MBB1505777.1 rhamnogalacturonan acetylesterase [Pseudoalteromonas sp. SG41-1]